MFMQIMTDQSETMSQLLDGGVRVLVYHGMMDMLLPVHGVADTLARLNWTGSEAWASHGHKKPYWSEGVEGQRASELMGYVQSAANLTFVTVRNAGHMVPIDQPNWCAKIVADFVWNKLDLNLGKGEIHLP